MAIYRLPVTVRFTYITTILADKPYVDDKGKNHGFFDRIVAALPTGSAASGDMETLGFERGKVDFSSLTPGTEVEALVRLQAKAAPGQDANRPRAWMTVQVTKILAVQAGAGTAA